MAESLGTDPKNIADLWTAIVGGVLTALALGITALTQYLLKRKKAAENPGDYEIASAYLEDSRPARKIASEVPPKLEAIIARLELMLEMSTSRGEDIKGLGQDHKELLALIKEVLALMKEMFSILRAMEKQSDRDRAVREDRERRMDRGS